MKITHNVKPPARNYPGKKRGALRIAVEQAVSCLDETSAAVLLEAADEDEAAAIRLCVYRLNRGLRETGYHYSIISTGLKLYVEYVPLVE